MSPKLHIVQHLYCKNQWSSLIGEQYRHLAGRHVHVTVVGSNKEVGKLKDIALQFSISLKIHQFRDPEVYEHEAMKLAQLVAASHPNDYLLYFHCKGSGNSTKKNLAWNHYLSYHLLHNLDTSFESLVSTGFDVTGALYTERKRDPNLDGSASRFFAGNFWIARNSYLNTLPDYVQLLKEHNNRFFAERFIGINRPAVCFIDQSKPYTYQGLFGVLRKINGLKSRGW